MVYYEKTRPRSAELSRQTVELVLADFRRG
jgi:hypothetical protein